MAELKYLICKNVHLGKNIQIQPGVVIGLPPYGKKNGEFETIIGDNAIIRSNTIIYAGVKIGNDFQTGHNVVIRENNEIGDGFNIWNNSVLSPHNKIGNRVKIHCNCFVESSLLEDGVFLAPGVVITDDLHPVCPKWKECVGGVTVGKNVSIGGNVTLLPGVIIGHNSLVGAGSVVTKNVPSDSVVVGNPAKVIKKMEHLKCQKKLFQRPYEWR